MRIRTVQQLRYCLDRCEKTDTKIVISGWAFFENEEIASIEAFIEGRDRELHSRAIAIQHGAPRADVRDIYGKSQALHSGFSATCPMPLFAPRRLRLVLHGTHGSITTVTARIRGARIDLARLAMEVWREATPSNVWMATRWIARGDFRRFRREILGLLEARSTAKVPATPLRDLLAGLAPKPDFPALDEPVDIIVPVYNGYQHLGPLFTSLKANTEGPYRLIVIEDCSPDERVRPHLRRLLEPFDSVIHVEHEENRGFVRSVNEGARHTGTDFVILNSDTVVPPGWLQRLVGPLRAAADVASITPFSNAATICSFPAICEDSPLWPDVTLARIDAAFQRIAPSQPPMELPTGVGFCMAMKQSVWQEIGSFDEETFGLGYGEENDWCLRAAAAGYRNIMAENLFVQHAHGGSFDSETRRRLNKQHLAIIQKRYPSYESQVRAFMHTDPLRATRTAAALTLAAQSMQKPVLIVDHDRGGGANHFRDQMIARRLQDGQPVLLLHEREASESDPSPFNLRLLIRQSRFDVTLSSLNELEMLLSQVIAPQEIYFNNLVGHRDPLALVDCLTSLKMATGARLTMALHDFYPLCPSYALMNNEGRFCGLPSQETCRACLPQNAFAADPTGATIGSWRETWGRLIGAADEVTCFSDDSRDHLLRVYPDCAPQVQVRPHDPSIVFSRKPEPGDRAALRVAVVGGISHQKGARVVEALARDLRKKRPTARVVVVGGLNNPVSLRNLTITGRYEAEHLPDILEAHGINVCLFPSIWPETYSYVTAELMALDMPIVAFDVGAPAERLRTYPRALLLPLAAAEHPGTIVEALTRLAGTDPAS
ncbi:glycosyltransferase [Breoghania sp.]|uniref:glycosyltransferase n=1 Tax=Breoghania sp. TaxID=2065378 RepID=UPI002AA710AD|nr:glycosyltransferase [Breoghania sp.]